MGISENIKNLRQKYNLSQKDLALIAGVTDKAVSTWENGLKEPRMGTIQKIADHFGIKKSDLIEDVAEPTLTSRDEKDIAKRLEQMMSDLSEKQTALMFDGEPLDDEDVELLKVSLENTLRLAKMRAKQKYTPNKYKK